MRKKCGFRGDQWSCVGWDKGVRLGLREDQLRAAEDGDRWGQGPLAGSCRRSRVPLAFGRRNPVCSSARSPFENRALNASHGSGYARDLPFPQPGVG